MFELLRDNYVEDSVRKFRFKYSQEFLVWALTGPGYVKDLNVGLRVQKNHKLVGFLSATPVTTHVCGKSINMAITDFLCVHSKLRNKRITPVLIKELTRRANVHHIWQGIYTAGKYMPTPISESHYYYRCLDYKKLVDVSNEL